MLSDAERHNARDILTFLSSQNRDYVIFGAGQVGRDLLRLIRAEGLRMPIAFIDDKAVSDRLDGVAIRGLGDLRSLAVREVVLGTNRFQEAMTQRLRSAGCSDLNCIRISPDPRANAAGSVANTTGSETAKIRGALAPYCVGDGIDVGYGGDPIVDSAICIDQTARYAAYAHHPQHLHGDARHLRWFADESLDYVYSSHVLEDFPDPATVLNEWLRVLRPGGHLVLFCPDEKLYRMECARLGKRPNVHHVHEDFGLVFVKRILALRKDVSVVHEQFPSCVYSFELVARKGSTVDERRRHLTLPVDQE